MAQLGLRWHSWDYDGTAGITMAQLGLRWHSWDLKKTIPIHMITQHIFVERKSFLFIYYAIIYCSQKETHNPLLFFKMQILRFTR
jgi:hypothetical protein